MSQWIPNSFQMPNALVDSGVLAKLKGSSLAMYIFIVRKTRGWQKNSDSISISQFVEFTGYGKDAVLSGADKLVEIGLIKRVDYQNKPALYVLNDMPDDVLVGESEKTTAENPHAEKTTGGVGKNDCTQSENPTHNNNIKTTNTKTNIYKFDFKSELKKLGAEDQLIQDWLLVRKNKKATNSETAFNIFEKELSKSGLAINDALTVCISKSWAGFEAAWVSKLNVPQRANTRNVNDAWGDEQHYAPATGEVDIGDFA